MRTFAENTLYVDASEKALFVSDKEAVTSAFLYNFVGLLGLLNGLQNKNKILTLVRSDKKVRIANIDDTNNDLSLSLKLVVEAGYFKSPVTVENITRFLAKLKTGSITTVDETIVKGWIIDGMKPSYRMDLPVKLRGIYDAIMNDGITLPDAAIRLKKLGRTYSKFSGDFFEIAKVSTIELGVSKDTDKSAEEIEAEEKAAALKAKEESDKKDAEAARIKTEQEASALASVAIETVVWNKILELTKKYLPSYVYRGRAKDVLNTSYKQRLEHMAYYGIESRGYTTTSTDDGAYASVVLGLSPEELKVAKKMDLSIATYVFAKETFYGRSVPINKKAIAFKNVDLGDYHPMLLPAVIDAYLDRYTDPIYVLITFREAIISDSLFTTVKAVFIKSERFTFLVNRFNSGSVAAFLNDGSDEFISPAISILTEAGLKPQDVRAASYESDIYPQIINKGDRKKYLELFYKPTYESDTFYLVNAILRDKYSSPIPPSVVKRVFVEGDLSNINLGLFVSLYIDKYRQNNYGSMSINLLTTLIEPTQYAEYISHVQLRVYIEAVIKHVALMYKKEFEAMVFSFFVTLANQSSTTYDAIRGYLSSYKDSDAIKNGLLAKEQLANPNYLPASLSEIARLYTDLNNESESFASVIKGTTSGQINPLKYYIQRIITDSSIHSIPAGVRSRTLALHISDVIERVTDGRTGPAGVHDDLMLLFANRYILKKDDKIKIIRDLGTDSGKSMIKYHIQTRFEGSGSQQYRDKFTAFASDLTYDLIDDNPKLVNLFLDSLDHPNTVWKVKNALTGSALVASGIASNGIDPMTKLDTARLKTVMEYNDIDYSSVVSDFKLRKKPSEGVGDYIKRAREVLKGKSILGDIKAKDAGLSQNELAKINKEIVSTTHSGGKHGNLYPKFVRAFDVSMDDADFVALRKQLGLTSASDVIPAFHGTGGIAACMILRFGFKIIPSDDPAATGRMLGDGIYFSNVIDKALQYVGNDGFGRRVGTRGYIFAMDVTLGKSAGSSLGRSVTGSTPSYATTDSTRSPEWAVAVPKSQLRIVRAYEVELVDKGTYDNLASSLAEGRVVKSFSSMINESVADPKNSIIQFQFYDGNVPVINTDGSISAKSPSEAQTYMPNNVEIERNAKGVAVLFRGMGADERIDVRFADELRGPSEKLYRKLMKLQSK